MKLERILNLRENKDGHSGGLRSGPSGLQILWMEGQLLNSCLGGLAVMALTWNSKGMQFDSQPKLKFSVISRYLYIYLYIYRSRVYSNCTNVEVLCYQWVQCITVWLIFCGWVFVLSYPCFCCACRGEDGASVSATGGLYWVWLPWSGSLPGDLLHDWLLSDWLLGYLFALLPYEEAAVMYCLLPGL